MTHIIIKKYFWFYSFIVIILTLPASLTAKEASCHKFVIQYVDFDILTISNVSCSYFEIAFKGQIKTRIFTNSQKITHLLKLLQKLKIDKTTKSVDVRMKITLYFNHKIEVICLDKFDVVINGCIYEMDKDISQFIEKLK